MPLLLLSALGTSTDTCLQLEVSLGSGETSPEHAFASSGVSQSLPGSHSLLPLCEREGSVPPSCHEKRMMLTLLWNREPGAAAGTGGRAIPWSQHQQPAPALVLGAFLRVLCNVVLTPSLPLVQASSLIRHSDKVDPEAAEVLSILPGSHLPLCIHQTLHSACWELSQLSLSSIFLPGWQFKRAPHNSVGAASLTQPVALLQPQLCLWEVPSSC